MQNTTYVIGDTVRVGKGKVEWKIEETSGTDAYMISLDTGVLRWVAMDRLTLITAAPVADWGSLADVNPVAVGDRVMVQGQGSGVVLELGGYSYVRLDTGEYVYAVREWLTLTDANTVAAEWVGVLVNDRDEYGQNNGETSFRCVACIDTDNYDSGLHLLPSEARPECQYCGLRYTLPVPTTAVAGDVVTFIGHDGELATGTVLETDADGMHVELAGHHLTCVRWDELRSPKHDAHVADWELFLSYTLPAPEFVDDDFLSVGDHVRTRSGELRRVVMINTHNGLVQTLPLAGEYGGYMTHEPQFLDYAMVTVTLDKQPRYTARQAVRMAQARRTESRIMRDVTYAVADRLYTQGEDFDPAYDEAKTITSHLRDNRADALFLAFGLCR